MGEGFNKQRVSWAPKSKGNRVSCHRTMRTKARPTNKKLSVWILLPPGTIHERLMIVNQCPAVIARMFTSLTKLVWSTGWTGPWFVHRLNWDARIDPSVQLFWWSSLHSHYVKYFCPWRGGVEKHPPVSPHWPSTCPPTLGTPQSLLLENLLKNLELIYRP